MASMSMRRAADTSASNISRWELLGVIGALALDGAAVTDGGCMSCSERRRRRTAQPGLSRGVPFLKFVCDQPLAVSRIRLDCRVLQVAEPVQLLTAGLHRFANHHLVEW